MSLHVRLSVNGQTIEVVRITNLGPTSEWEGHPDGERYYDWSLESSSRDAARRIGTVKHRRAAGATALAARVLIELEQHRRDNP